MKKFVSGAVLSVLMLSVASGHAAKLESKAVAGPQVTQHSGVAGIDSVIREAGQVLDSGGTRIFAVLGAGLVAVSLLARRRKSR